MLYLHISPWPQKQLWHHPFSFWVHSTSLELILCVVLQQFPLKMLHELQIWLPPMLVPWYQLSLFFFQSAHVAQIVLFWRDLIGGFKWLMRCKQYVEQLIINYHALSCLRVKYWIFLSLHTPNEAGIWKITNKHMHGSPFN